MKVLIVDDEKVLREVSATLMETHYDCEIVEALSGNHAKTLLEKSTQFDIILCDYKMPDGCGDVVYNCIKQMSNPPAFVMISAWSYSDCAGMEKLLDDSKNNAYVSKPYSAKQLYEKVDQVLESKSTLLDAPEEEYCRLNMNSFLDSGFYEVDVFLKISDKKYVKIADKNEFKKNDIIDKYMEKDVQHIYLLKEDYDLYLANLFKKVENKLNSGDLKAEEFFAVQVESIEAIHDIVFNIGVSERVIKLTDQYISATLDNIKSKSTLYSLLEAIYMDNNYIYVHAHLTSYLVCAMSGECNWVDADHERHLIYAALFQNACLQDNRLAMIYDTESREWDSLKENQKKLVKTHMIKIVELLDEMEDFSTDAKNAILNHHERPGGSGFPRGLTEKQISAMDGLFIIASHFAHEIIVQGTSPSSIHNLKEFFKSRYNTGNYQDAITAFSKVFK